MSKLLLLCGNKRVGKDTAASYLVKTGKWKRVSFADALKDMAYDLNPLIEKDIPVFPLQLRLTIDNMGWEDAKDKYSAVREYLIHLGNTVRKYDPNFWVRLAAQAVEVYLDQGYNVVITDCRFINEVVYFTDHWTNVKLLRITREDYEPHNEDEAKIAGFPYHISVPNCGTPLFENKIINAVNSLF